MFWDWFFTFFYALCACCGIANMMKEKTTGNKIFRAAIATVMLVAAIVYGNATLIKCLGV